MLNRNIVLAGMKIERYNKPAKFTIIKFLLPNQELKYIT